MADLTEWGKILIELSIEREERRKRELQVMLDKWNNATQGKEIIIKRSTAVW